MEIENEKAKNQENNDFSKTTLAPEDKAEAKKKIRMERQFTRYDNKSGKQACFYWVRLGFTLYFLYLLLVLTAVIFPFTMPYYMFEGKIKSCSTPARYLAIFFFILAGFVFSPVFWLIVGVLYAIGLLFALIYYPIVGLTMCFKQCCVNSAKEKSQEQGFAKFHDEEQS